jgi:hypothetical protein
VCCCQSRTQQPVDRTTRPRPTSASLPSKALR